MNESFDEERESRIDCAVRAGVKSMMTEGELMAQAMVEFLKDVVSAVAIVDAEEYGRLRIEEKNSSVILRILQSNVEHQRAKPVYPMMKRLLEDFSINVREQSTWSRG